MYEGQIECSNVEMSWSEHTFPVFHVSESHTFRQGLGILVD